VTSLYNIPEPTTVHPPTTDEDPAAISPRPLMGHDPGQGQTADPQAQEQQAEDLANATIWLIALTLCGLLLRLVGLYLSPTQALADRLEPWVQAARDATNAAPLSLDATNLAYPMLAWGLDATGLPVWCLPLLQAFIGIAAIPAAYVIGHRLTGRSLAGVLGAGIVALHPAVITWTITFSPAPLAFSCILIGWALLCEPKRIGIKRALSGGLLLATAFAFAPIAWLAGLGAGVWVGLSTGGKRGILLGAVVLTLSVGPAIAWRVWANPKSATDSTSLTDISSSGTPQGFLSSWCDTSMTPLGEQLGFALTSHGPVSRLLEGRAGLATESDPIADVLGDAWVVLNAALLLMAITALPLLLLRGQWATAIALGLVFGGLALTDLGDGEAARLPMLGLLFILATGWLAVRKTPRLSPEEREALRAEKELLKQQRLDAKLDIHQAKSGLYAFDKQTPPKTKTTEHDAPSDSQPTSMRPI